MMFWLQEELLTLARLAEQEDKLFKYYSLIKLDHWMVKETYDRTRESILHVRYLIINMIILSIS